jgi:hypothetical protein
MLVAVVAGCGGSDAERRIVAPGFEPVVSAWKASPDLHDPGKPAGLGAIDFAERALGRPIPADLIALLRYADGGSFLENNLGIYPVDRLLGLNDDPHRPPELLLFADDGSNSLFGVWAPRLRREATAPVVEYDPGGGGLALAGTSVQRFLTTRTAYYLMLYDAAPALDALGVPPAVRVPSLELDDDTYAALERWADPRLPQVHARLYESGITVEELRRRYGGDSA